MKSNLSHILPVWKACRILGEPVVRRIVGTVIRLRSGSSNRNNNNPGDTAVSMSGSLQQHEEDEVEYLMKALFYEDPYPNKGSSQSAVGGTSHSIPPVIAQGWKNLTSKRSYALDKASLFKFLVPALYQPHSGSNGHMGLFDCFAYALQGHAPTSSATYYGGASAAGLVWIPDIIIFLAVCQQYSNKMAEVGSTTSALNEDDIILQQKALSTMALMAFRMYDAYQKKGTVTRDTVHRFLTDVHGEQSFKVPNVKEYLDRLFTVNLTPNRMQPPQPQETPHPVEQSSLPPPAGSSRQTQSFSVAQNQQQSQEMSQPPSPPPQQQPNNNNNINLQASLSETQFCKQVLEVKENRPGQQIENGDSLIVENQHILLDWIAQLGLAMKPLQEIPKSTSLYLETIENTFRPVCSMYRLADHRLYEIKRRFHSLVESNVQVIEGDVVQDCPDMSKPSTAGTAAATTTTVPAAATTTTTAASNANLPKHVITESAFLRAVMQPNDEMGHGGYLPMKLAQLTFQAGCGHQTALLDENFQMFWGLNDVLRFGCEAVRFKIQENDNETTTTVNYDLPLIKFIFSIFAINSTGENESFDIDSEEEKKQTDSINCNTDGLQDKPSLLNRQQIGKMLCFLMEHIQFRIEADSSPSKHLDDIDEEVEQHQERRSLVLDKENAEDTLLYATAAEILGLLSPQFIEHQNESNSDTNVDAKVQLRELIDYFFEEAEAKSKTYVTFEEFARWHYKKYSNNETDTIATQRQRLGPLMLELRLIAAVLFGIPPTLASMELLLMTEIHRRHKLRYPPTDVSRRGPRGTVWYIIDHRWYLSWSTLVQKVKGTELDEVDGRDAAAFAKTPRGLGKINNRPLMADNGSLALRSDIKWRHDYEILPPLGWSALQAWYDGGPHIHRNVVPYVPSVGAASPHSRKPRIRTENEIELYPFFVTVFLCDATSRGEARPFQQYVPVSRVSPVRVVLLQLCKGLDVDPDYGRLWVMGFNLEDQDPAENNGNEDWLLNLDQNIVEQRNRRNSNDPNSSITLLLELKDPETGLWPRGKDGKSWSFTEKAVGGEAMPETGDGIVGLYNMGNTCYLNSSIQCLSHTPVFRDYFTSKAYLNDINTTNPLGHQGRLAQVSAVLINSLWKRFNNQGSALTHGAKRVTTPGTHFPVNAPNLTPKTFKESIGKFNDLFAGNEQHDAQELLAFLLGGLSEDLNRIVDKPYIEAPDSDGRLSDSELADIWWSNHLKREFSIIVALFTGQYKSLLTCRSCKYESARFEPFSFLQLPLPEDDHIVVSLILYPLCRDSNNASRGTSSSLVSTVLPSNDVLKYNVRVRNDGTLLDVLIELYKILYADMQKSTNDNGISSNDKKDEESKKNDGVTDDGDHELSSDQAMEEIYLRGAKNLAVVDMRDGYISKVASNSWALPDLQNKDTGELPLLHVYELDPLPEENMPAVDYNNPKNSNSENLGGSDSSKPAQKDEENTDEKSNNHNSFGASTTANDSETNATEDNSVDEDKKEVEKSVPSAKYSFLALAQRKSELMSRDFLHPLTHRVIGTPLLLRVVDLESYTGHQLYDLVAKRLRNLVPKSALRFLVDSNRTRKSIVSTKPSTEEEKEQQQPRSGSAPSPRESSRLRKTTTDMEEVSAGPVPRYGFRLRLTSRDGRRCTLCPWYECCIGCLVPDDESPTIVMCGDSIAIDWHFAVDIATSGFGQRFNQVDQVSQPSTGPPRSRIPGVVVKNHSSCGTGSKKGFAGAITLEDCLDAFAKEEKIPEAYCSKCKDFRVQTKRMSLWRLPPVVIIHLKRFQFTQHMRRKLRDLVVFPVEGLDLSRIMASDKNKTASANDISKSEAINGDTHKISETETLTVSETATSTTVEDESVSEVPVEPSPDSSSSTSPSHDDGRSVMLYDLYGVVHHQGALSGGHYVASLKSDIDGQWRLFNDSTVYEIHSRDVVDSSAYILFYVRRDVKGARLSDYWDTSTREGEGLTEEDMDKLIRGRSDRCVVS